MTQYFSKKFLIGLALFSFVLGVILLPGMVSGQKLGDDLVSRAAREAGYAPATDTTFSTNIGTVVRVALSFVGVIFLILTVYAGFLWMTARGDEGKVDKSTAILRTSIIGLFITLGAYSITTFVLPIIISGGNDGVTGTTNTQTGVCEWEFAPPLDSSGSETNLNFNTCRERCRTQDQRQALRENGCSFNGQLVTGWR